MPQLGHCATGNLMAVLLVNKTKTPSCYKLVQNTSTQVATYGHTNNLTTNVVQYTCINVQVTPV